LSELTDSATGDETDDDRDWDGFCAGAQRDLPISVSLPRSLAGRGTTYATDEDDRLKALSKDRDEREEEQSPLSSPPLRALERPVLRPVVRDSLGMTVLKRCGELDSPLDTSAVHPKEGDAHDEDDERGDNAEGAFPDLLGLGPEVD
jgi:hypothetical protein